MNLKSNNDSFAVTDQERISELLETRRRNNDVFSRFADFLNNAPRYITPYLMNQLDPSGTAARDMLYQMLVASLLEFDPDGHEYDRQIVNDYIRPAIKKLNVTDYTNDLYYQKIRIQETTFGQWNLTRDQYEPYEAFVYNNPRLMPDFREIPRIGFFDEPFSFPVVQENGREWMAIKPNEMETMRPVLEQVRGNVLVLGLGLGYFPFHAALKNEVETITVVERDSRVIELFQKYLFPQFPCQNKWEIVQSEAMEFLNHQLPNYNFDFAFVDLWHDASDGLDPYLAIKLRERFYPQTHFLYWIEDSLLSAFRSQIFDYVVDHSRSFDEIRSTLDNSGLVRLIEQKGTFRT